MLFVLEHKILSLVSRYQKKYPWAQILLELVPEVEIQLFSDWSTPAGRPISMKYS
jgi:hypothetical protein